ncbi:MAG: hypothetical protein R3E12_03890 [Candidatus Eisenbacteria bacterium]
MRARAPLEARGWLAAILGLGLVYRVSFAPHGTWPVSLLGVGGLLPVLYLVGTRWLGPRHPFRIIGGSGVAVWDRAHLSVALGIIAIASRLSWFEITIVSVLWPRR